MGFLLLASTRSPTTWDARYTSGGNYRSHGGLPRPGGVGRQLGRTQPAPGGLFPRRARHSKSLAVSTPTNAKGLMKAAIRDKQPPLLLSSSMCCALQPQRGTARG